MESSNYFRKKIQSWLNNHLNYVNNPETGHIQFREHILSGCYQELVVRDVKKFKEHNKSQ